MEYYLEYGIYRKINNGSPFCVNTYRTLPEAKYTLENVFIADDKEQGRTYFVDNDFFENDYSEINGKFNYYKIVVRQKSKWVNIEQIQDIENNNCKINKSKVINFIDYI